MKKSGPTLEQMREHVNSLNRMLAGRQPNQTFSQAEIARFCGVSRAAISNCERKALRKLREALRRELGLTYLQITRRSESDL